jgi:hypothetical protein
VYGVVDLNAKGMNNLYSPGFTPLLSPPRIMILLQEILY